MDSTSTKIAADIAQNISQTQEKLGCFQTSEYKSYLNEAIYKFLKLNNFKEPTDKEKLVIDVITDKIAADIDEVQSINGQMQSHEYEAYIEEAIKKFSDSLCSPV